MSKSNNKQNDEEPVVYLGYIEDGDNIKNELTELLNETDAPGSSKDNSADQSVAPWLINKIGGTPMFPYNGINISELESVLNSMRCKHCKSDCVLIFQINSPIDDSPLDRIIQVYTCIKSDCIKHSWYSMRCLLSTSKPSNHSEESGISIESDQLELIVDPVFGRILVCLERAFFEPYYVSVIDEPTGRENFAKNNLEALKLASKFSDPDLKPASIEAKYKNLKNYKPPQPPANLSDLDDFEKFQMEKLYGNDKDMYRFFKRLSRYQAQVVRYDWEGEPLINSNKIKLNLQPCSCCSSKRKFEFQLMSALINYLKTDKEFDRESMDFSSIIIHSCSKNCSIKTFNLEDTYFMPDPDSRIFNKVKQRVLALKLNDKDGVDKSCEESTEQVGETSESAEQTTSSQPSNNLSSKPKKKKNKKGKNKK